MIRFYTTENGHMHACDKAEPGCWISVVSPTPQEVAELIEAYGLDSGFVKSSIDEEESSRIEREDDQTLVIIDAPFHRLAVLPSSSTLDDVDNVLTQTAVIGNGRSD